MWLANIIFVIFTISSASCVVEFQIRNNGGLAWIGIQGNLGHPHLNNGGFALSQGGAVSINAPDNWAGRFWSRTYCDPNTNHCITGDCGKKVECNGTGGDPPATFVEISLNGAGGKDFYDISLVNGFNNLASIAPIGGQGDDGKFSCKKTTCGSEINNRCPKELLVRHDNYIIACNSACNAFPTDQYCCKGAYSTPDTCNPSDWPTDYPSFFKKECPNAYSYAYDDNLHTLTCKASTYVIVFG